ncbi:MAG: cysteine hydrolase [Solirubrobacterales bacterium]|nr:cysteine hydrolase [Solirubrobacterales bacterium]
MTTRPYAPIEWDLVPTRTALIVIDAQNDFLHSEGWYALRGVDIEHMRRCIEPIKQLVAACRARDVPIIWTLHGFRDAQDGGWLVSMRPFLREGGLRIGTWGYELLEELGAGDRDRYVVKNRLSAFYQTNLELQLRAIGAETVLIAGVLTNQCVAATSKDAMFRDLKPIVVEEATGTTLPHLHAPALEMMRVGWAEVRGLEASLQALRALPARQAGAVGEESHPGQDPLPGQDRVRA